MPSLDGTGSTVSFVSNWRKYILNLASFLIETSLYSLVPCFWDTVSSSSQFSSAFKPFSTFRTWFPK